jgi:uncharacterized alkaline shock family protein YloU
VTIPDRILLFFYACIVAFISLLVFIQAIGFNVFPLVFGADGTAIAIGVSLLLFLISVRFLLIRSGRRRRREPEAIIRTTDCGDIRISLTTLESLAVRAARGIRGVHDLKTKVHKTEHGIRVAMKMACDPDLDIPVLTETLQTKVKHYVEETSGTNVEEVRVYVEDIAKRPVAQGTRQSRLE